MKTKIRTWFFQQIANFIIYMGTNGSASSVGKWCAIGNEVDSYCIAFYDIYLE